MTRGCRCYRNIREQHIETFCYGGVVDRARNARSFDVEWKDALGIGVHDASEPGFDRARLTLLPAARKLANPAFDFRNGDNGKK